LANKIEGVHGIGKKETEIWFRGHLFPELSGASFDSCLEASTELVSATSVCGNGTGNGNHGFGHETLPDLADANWADTRFFVKSYESVGHESSDGFPGADVIGKPLGEAGNGFAESLADSFVAKEPSFEGGTVGSAKACGAFELLGHISNCAWGDQKFWADRDGGVDREVQGGKGGVRFGMFLVKQLKNGLAAVFIKLFGVENAGGLLPFRQEADGLLFFAFHGKMLEGLKTFFWSADTVLGFELGCHVADG